MGRHLSDDCYVIMSQHGIERMTKRKGSLKRGEIAVRIKLSVPESAFTDPDVVAHITVPESAIIRPVVSVEALDAPVDERTDA